VDCAAFIRVSARDRVLVLLALLGGQSRVELDKDAIEAVCP
jgi:hypothetical protein